jgi:hypothetical protein
MRSHQVHSFLVGEAFMRQDDPGAALPTCFPAQSQPSNFICSKKRPLFQWPFCFQHQ